MTRCPSLKTQCKNNKLIKSVKKLITQLSSDEVKDLIPVTKKDLIEMQKALDLYIIECNKCARKTGSDYKCMRAAAQNLQRRIPIFSKTIYPWKNYDWNYSNYVSNNYMPRHTGATKKSTIQAMYNNVLAISKVLGGLIDDPIPNHFSRAAIRSRNSDYPSLEDCVTTKCKTTQEIANSLSSQLNNPPTTDKFLRENPVDGKYSSSYYVKIGSCPRRDIKTVAECEKRGYTWSPSVIGKIIKTAQEKREKRKKKDLAESTNDTPQPKEKVSKTDPGTCSQPRYIFIDNSPKSMLNGSNMQGMLPSLANDIRSIMPDKIFSVAMGNSLRNTFDIQQCPSTEEGYFNYKKTNTRSWIINIVVCLILLLLWVFVSHN